ncbi:polysaccharide deacetylase [Thauera sinica]|nr:polysaccharide deacetylase [Thauera sp. K11]
MYHRIGDAHNDWERKYCVSPSRFAEHMDLLRARGWHAVTLRQFLDWLDGSVELPAQSFLLTFDDGFLGVHEHAAPVLQSLGWPATVFLVSTLVGKRDTWCEAHNPSGATYPLMDAHHLRELQSCGFRFESHTRSHPDLPTLDDDALGAELAGSRAELQDLLGSPIEYLAYPFGRHDERVVQAARNVGYLAAFSTRPGFNRDGMDRFRLRRLDVFGTDTAAALSRKIRLGSNDGSVAKSLKYSANRLLARMGLTAS